MADSNFTRISTKRESTWGTAPGGTYEELSATGGSFTQNVSTTRSNKKRTDGQRAAAVRVGVDPTASIDFELYPGDIDALFPDFIRSSDGTDGAWPTAKAVTTATAFVAADNKATSSGGAFVSAGNFAETTADGDWVYISGTDNNNGWHKVKDWGTGEITFDGDNIVDEDAISTTFKSQQVANGTTAASYTVEMSPDSTNGTVVDKAVLMAGARPTGMSLDISLGSIITGNFGFAGKSLATPAAQKTVNAADSTDAFGTVDDFDEWFWDYNKKTDDLLAVNFDLSTDVRARQGLGSGLTKSGITQNAVSVSGGLNFYRTTSTYGNVYTDFTGYTARSLAFSLSNSDGYRYLFEFPAVRLTGEPGNIGGPDEDLEFQFTWEAEPGKTYSTSTTYKTIIITRVAV